ncbi:vesicle-associated membrane protein 727 [Tanacetum coccineum]
MSQKGLIYSFVAKGTVVLAEHTAYSGNVSTVAVQCLQKLPSGSPKYTYACDGYTFNFLLDTGFVFLVVADESAGRSVPFVFLERVKDDFKKRYGASIGSDHPLADDSDDDLFEDRFSIAYNLDREFGPKIKEHMDYCLNHPDEMSKLSKLKAQITEVKGIMMDNIEKHEVVPCMPLAHRDCSHIDTILYVGDLMRLYLVLDRGEKIELLVDKTENLQFQLPKAGKVTKKEDVVAESSDEADGRRSHCHFYHHSVANGLSGIQMLKTFYNLASVVLLSGFTKELS